MTEICVNKQCSSEKPGPVEHQTEASHHPEGQKRENDNRFNSSLGSIDSLFMATGVDVDAGW